MVRKSEYHDSVSLMLVARELSMLGGIEDAAVVMATEVNKAILAEAGLLSEQARLSTPNDLVIAVSAENEGTAENALKKAEEILLRKKVGIDGTAEFRPKTIHGARAIHPDSNVAVISVAGRYATDQAWEALRRGLHVLLFSDNVSIEDESALKEYAREHGLLLMGPGAGSSILNNIGLGFANAVPKGSVGIVSAAGTGLQEVSTLIARYGAGISQAIGVGGRDLGKEVKGIMTLEVLKALQNDPATEVIALISKPPAEKVSETVLEQATASNKPVIVCFLGGRLDNGAKPANTIFVRTLQETALQAAKKAGARVGQIDKILQTEKRRLARDAESLRARLSPGQRFLRGLFTGGTLCYEAQVVLQDILQSPVYSNAPLPGNPSLPEPTKSLEHSVVDLGEEEFTLGRLHPMIDPALRERRLLQEAGDPFVAVILLDVVLGYGAHPNPAGALAHNIEESREAARAEKREPTFLASVTGTEDDPQRRGRTISQLEEVGVIVLESNAAAAWLAGKIVSG